MLSNLAREDLYQGIQALTKMKGAADEINVLHWHKQYLEMTAVAEMMNKTDDEALKFHSQINSYGQLAYSIENKKRTNTAYRHITSRSTIMFHQRTYRNLLQTDRDSS